MNTRELSPRDISLLFDDDDLANNCWMNVLDTPSYNLVVLHDSQEHADPHLQLEPQQDEVLGPEVEVVEVEVVVEFFPHIVMLFVGIWCIYEIYFYMDFKSYINHQPRNKFPY